MILFAHVVKMSVIFIRNHFFEIMQLSLVLHTAVRQSTETLTNAELTVLFACTNNHPLTTRQLLECQILPVHHVNNRFIYSSQILLPENHFHCLVSVSDHFSFKQRFMKQLDQIFHISFFQLAKCLRKPPASGPTSIHLSTMNVVPKFP